MAQALERHEELLQAGGEALARAAWVEARDAFEVVLAERESPEALLGLGVAARALFDTGESLHAHERGYRLASEAGERRVAARFALELALDCLSFRGPAEARGWLERAARLLEGLAPGMEQGVLAYFRARYALSVDHDPEAAPVRGEGAALARAGGVVEGELVCSALEGPALVAQGRVEAGMPLLDEAAAAAAAGEVRDPQLVEVICCHLIDACQRVRDFDRAGEWCRRVEEIGERFGDAEMFATCRTLYGEVLLWQGAWRDAERTLTAVCRQLAGAQVKAMDGLVRLAELRRRQGRAPEAVALVERCGEHRLAAVVRSALALESGDAATAAEEAERYLRRLGRDTAAEQAEQDRPRRARAAGRHARQTATGCARPERADTPRAGGAQPAGAGPLERGDRGRAGAERTHGRIARRQRV